MIRLLFFDIPSILDIFFKGTFTLIEIKASARLLLGFSCFWIKNYINAINI
jgi:hypothetical protein